MVIDPNQVRYCPLGKNNCGEPIKVNEPYCKGQCTHRRTATYHIYDTLIECDEDTSY